MTSLRVSRETGVGRLPSLDVMRGLIIVLMAIDHARGFIAKNHPGEFWGRPLPDYGGDSLAFLTRLVTHLCAPGFFFLMGTGMVLLATARGQAGWPPGRVTRHLALRGLLLILIGQLTETAASLFAFANATRVESYGARPPGVDGTVPYIILGVLYGLGASLIIGSLLVRLRPGWLIALAAGCAIAGDLITPSAADVDVRVQPLMRLLLIPGQTGPILSVYPALSWLPCTLLGMAFAHWLDRDRERAFSRLLIGGIVFVVLFVGLRLPGGFGNITPPVDGWVGFFNMVKYPPSMVFLLFALGIDFLLLAAIDRARLGETTAGRILSVFGSAPLFFFAAHLWLYAAIGRAFPAGTTIPQMYPLWLAGLVLLYLPCRWYRDFKQRRPPQSVFRML